MSGPTMGTTDPVLGSPMLETSTGAFCGRRAAPWTPHLCSVGGSWRPSVLTVRAQGNSSEAEQDPAKKQQLRGCLLSLPCALPPSAISSLCIQCLLHRHHHHPHSPGPCLRDAHRYSAPEAWNTIMSQYCYPISLLRKQPQAQGHRMVGERWTPNNRLSRRVSLKLTHLVCLPVEPPRFLAFSSLTCPSGLPKTTCSFSDPIRAPRALKSTASGRRRP